MFIETDSNYKTQRLRLEYMVAFDTLDAKRVITIMIASLLDETGRINMVETCN